MNSLTTSHSSHFRVTGLSLVSGSLLVAAMIVLFGVLDRSELLPAQVVPPLMLVCWIGNILAFPMLILGMRDATTHQRLISGLATLMALPLALVFFLLLIAETGFRM